MSSRIITPQRTQTIGMWLFLTSLTMLFAAAMLGYVLIRLTSNAVPENFKLHLPWTLWPSTLLMLGASVAMHNALAAVRREKLDSLRRLLLGAAVLAGGFVILQIPSMMALLSAHSQLNDTRLPLYGLVFFLVLVHAAHVAGGLIALGLAIRKAFTGGYDHENHVGIYHSTLYWHFLDIVWLVMFGTMLAIG